MKVFGTEPTTWVTLIMLGLKMAVAFGLPLTDVQSTAIQNFLDVAIIAIGGLIIRQSVISVAAVDNVQGSGAADKIAAANKAGTTQLVTPGGPASVLLAILLGGSLLVSACASRADGTKLSPEGAIALRGAAVVNAINNAAPAIETLTQPNSCGTRACLTAEEGLQVAKTIDRGLQAAEQLPPILTTVDQATDASAREQGIGKARAALQEVTKAIADAQILPQLAEARTKVVAALLAVQIALLAVGGF